MTPIFCQTTLCSVELVAMSIPEALEGPIGSPTKKPRFLMVFILDVFGFGPIIFFNLQDRSLTKNLETKGLFCHPTNGVNYHDLHIDPETFDGSEFILNIST